MIPLTENDRALIERAAAVAPELQLDALDDAAALRLVRTHGPELATAVIYDRIRRCPRHAGLAARMDQADAPPIPPDMLIGLVPGAFYTRHSHTGADGERVLAIARKRGVEAERIELLPFGGIDKNGRLIAEWLSAKVKSGRRVVLVTLSKGTLDASEAVRLSDAKTVAHIAGWLSLSGLWTGTALVDWLDQHPWRRLLVRTMMAVWRMPYGTVESLRRSDGGRVERLPGARVISVVGVPLRGHLRHRWAPKAYDRLSMIGPSDGGGIMLSDVRHFPGEVFPVWGSDHYLDPAWDLSPLISRLLLEAMHFAGRPAPDNQPAPACATTANAIPASRSTA